jgi:hypothetical protein
VVIINGTDLTTLGFVAENRGLPRLLGRETRIVRIPGRLGGVRGGGDVPSTRLEVPGNLIRTSHANLLTAIDNLSAALHGECVIRFSDITDREWIGWLSAVSRVGATGIDWIGTVAPVTLVFDLPDPTARAQAATTGTSLSPVLALGNAPSPINVSVQNGAGAAITDITVQVLDGSAAVITELIWSGSVPSSGLWELTSDPYFEVAVNDTNAVSGLSPGSRFPIADPAEDAVSLQIFVSGGASPAVSWSYRKRW